MLLYTTLIKSLILYYNKIEERFLNYARTIKVQSDCKDTWVVAFILRNNLKNSIIQLKKKENLINVKKYQSIKIIEINSKLDGENELGTEEKELIKLYSAVQYGAKILKIKRIYL